MKLVASYCKTYKTIFSTDGKTSLIRICALLRRKIAAISQICTQQTLQIAYGLVSITFLKTIWRIIKKAMKSAVGWRNSTASFNKQTSKIPMNPTVIISRQFQNHTRLRRQNLIGWFIGKGSLTVMSCKHRTTRIVTEATISAGNLFVGGVCFIFYPGSSCLYYLYNLIVQQKLRSKRRKTHTYLGAVSIRKTVLPGMAIPMLKIRRPNGRLIFNMEIAICR